MAEDKLEISKIRLPSGNVYDIKDETARDSIPTKTSQLENDSKFINYTEESGEVSISGKEPLYKDITYSALNTKHKTIIEAINDAAESGGGGGGGAVEDVQVDGESVLDDMGIANIELTEYVKGTEPKEGTVVNQKLALYKESEYSDLETQNKTVLGAINELVEQNVVCTAAEYEALPDIEKIGKFFFIYEEE